MVSLFGILNMGAQSLSVETDASAVTGQNLANVTNPAYAEETVNVQEATPLDTTIGQEGTGVQAVSITEIRNALLDSQIQAEGSVTGSLTSQQSALTEAEAYLNEQLSGSTTAGTSSPNGLTADLGSFYSSLQSLSTDPGNISDRQAVIQAAQQLAQQFNSVSSGLSTVTANLNSTIQSDVVSSNQDLSQIAGLNQQIIQAQASGGNANPLIDQREQLIENLSGMVNLTTSAQADGAVNISIGGVAMVTGASTPDTLGDYIDANGNVGVMESNNGGPLVLSGGSIEGSITARDGAVADLSNSLNTLASQLITQFNSIYSNGYDLNGTTHQTFFTGSNAANIGVNSTVANDPTTFQASGTSGDAGDNTVVLALANSANQTLAGLNNQTVSQSYTAAVGSFGSALQSVNEQLSNSQAVSQMLTSQRSSASGVDTDTEMTNLMQFQKAYEASAEMISTVNEMLETLVTMKTE
jgi:flagellar hook-associated protein 1